MVGVGGLAVQVSDVAQDAEKQSEIIGRGSNQSGMRAHNERLVLTLLRRHGPLAKSEIARSTGLSAQTVSVIMRALEDDGLLRRGDPVRGKVGQPSVPMRLDPEGAYFLGLKVGRRSTELVLTDFMGRVTGRASRLHAYPDPDEVVRFAVTQIAAIREGLTPRQRDRIAGLGIAIPFFLWDWAQHLGVPEAAMAAWRDADIRTEIAGRTGLPVFLENDASSACGAEIVFGPYESDKDFLYFYVGYFIGGGIVLNGKLFTGRGNAAALGPIPVPDGRGGMCQLLEVASLSVLEERLRAKGQETAAMWETTEGWDFDSEVLSDWIAKTAQGLAHAIASACSVVDFGAVRIDGWLPLSLRRELVMATRKALGKLDLSGLTVPQIATGNIGPDARSLGAASLPLSGRFLID